ncbi:PilZ domain-containing protein [Lysobacter solisilvae (ex Woo and Kim 2020)]|uniref:PilZ domain-containing protein n=1 Tax=Agrilutibacter terrestris TaxID=2865112 RepID=A0A7H0FXP2_9GAMM|nr:PilZ domain-containing protein [Lysobacter terrestris]QNP40808.1 PilZ domain-containing protein [Lysobacter terrestris]
MNAVIQDERRSTDRVPYASRIMVLRHDSAWFARLIDLSVGGCSIFRPAGFELVPDDLVRLFFHQGEDAAVVIVDARVARVTTGQVGLEYHDPQTVPPTPPSAP